MNKIAPLVLLLSSTAFGQGFVNGSFELTTSVGCDYNNTIAAFNAVMDNVVMFEGTETDIQEDGCYIPSIPEGEKVIGLANSDAVNMELTEPLVSGLEYSITFSLHGNTSFGILGSLELGATEDSGVMGTFLGTADPILADTWEEHTIVFTAPNNATHISIRNSDVGPWNQVDDFNIEMSCVPLEIEASETALCFDEELVLTADGEGTVTWEGGVINGEEFIPDMTGIITYTVTSDSDLDCPNSIDIEVYELPEVIATADLTEICFGDSIILAGDGTATEYIWDPAAVIDGIAFSPETTGDNTYTVTGTDDNGCENEDDITVTVNDLPAVVAEVTDNEICLGETVVLTGSGALTYVWDPEEVIDGDTYTPTETGTFTVLGVDDNGCENIASVEVTVYPALEITYETIDETFGSDGEIDITVTGGNPAYDFDWDNDGLGEWGDDEDLIGLVAGTYVVVVEDDAGCIAEASIVVNSQVGLVDNNLDVSIYPNPTKGDITVVYNGVFNYTLYTIDGALLMQGVGANTHIVSLENYAPGIYYIALNGEEKRAIYKLVKQ